MIESAYKLAPLNVNSWKTLQRACQIYFMRNVVPNFINLDTLPDEDRAVLLTGKNSNVSHLFKVAQCLKIQGAEATSSRTHYKKEDMCPLQNKVSWRSQRFKTHEEELLDFKHRQHLFLTSE